MAMAGGKHRDALLEGIGLGAEGDPPALAAGARAPRALLAGDAVTAAERVRAAAARYRASWELAPPRSYGRLIGMLKALVIARDDDAARHAAAYVRAQVSEDDASAPAWYALGIAALVEGDDALAARAAAGMGAAGVEPFLRTAAAVDALARGDGAASAGALAAIVADFEARDEHLTGVPIADTALMLERLADARGIAARPPSPLLPACRVPARISRRARGRPRPPSSARRASGRPGRRARARPGRDARRP